MLYLKFINWIDPVMSSTLSNVLKNTKMWRFGIRNNQIEIVTQGNFFKKKNSLFVHKFI